MEQTEKKNGWFITTLNVLISSRLPILFHSSSGFSPKRQGSWAFDKSKMHHEDLKASFNAYFLNNGIINVKSGSSNAGYMGWYQGSVANGPPKAITQMINEKKDTMI